MLHSPFRPAGQDCQAADVIVAPRTLITPDRARYPLSAMMLALSMTGWAQTAAPKVEAADTSSATTVTVGAATDSSLAPVVVKGKAEVQEQGRDSVRAKTTTIGKGKQDLRDVPQSVTVVTEKLINDRNLDTLKDVLHNTAGVTFQAAEGGEEDIRLRGFSLATTGDIFVDGMRDPAFYERDTFGNDRVELLRGSASMLFGRGSTGGAVNQVSKMPFLDDQHEVGFAVGSYNYRRLVGDFNFKTGENAGLRINAMTTEADNNGAGTSIDKRGVSVAYSYGIGTTDEFTAMLYNLDNRNGINYGIPWIRSRPGNNPTDTTIVKRLDPSDYYGMASDKNEGGTTNGTLIHTHRFQNGGELRTAFRAGHYDRDQRASAIRFVDANTNETNLSDATALRRGTNLKIQTLDTRYLQSDYSGKFDALGAKHAVLAGFDYALERFKNYNAATPAGVTLTKPNTTIGTPDDGASINEDARILTLGRAFEAKSLGVYAQDLIQVAPAWKILVGLRHDNFVGRFSQPAFGTTQAALYGRTDALWSKRAGILYQPTELSSFHFSYGTSFNTSGDTYQYDNQTTNTPPEGSINLELGAKLDSPDQRFTTRLAVFRTTKTNERNRDPDSAAQFNLLSGRRHSAGIEIDGSGKLTKQWEVYGSYAWTPIAKIDVGAPGSIPGVAEGTGTRSSLTPRHSGTIWSTYQLTPHFRFGGGLNYRSEQTPNRNPGWSAPAFWTGDLMAEYTFDRYAIKANLINVTNKLYADSLYTGHYVPGVGRNFQVTFTAKF